jgi:hypothetical protein
MQQTVGRQLANCSLDRVDLDRLLATAADSVAERA